MLEEIVLDSISRLGDGQKARIRGRGSFYKRAILSKIFRSERFVLAILEVLSESRQMRQRGEDE